MHAGIVSDCPWRSVTNADAPKVSKKTGSWALTQAYIYYLDKGLVFALARFFLRNGGSLVKPIHCNFGMPVTRSDELPTPRATSREV